MGMWKLKYTVLDSILIMWKLDLVKETQGSPCFYVFSEINAFYFHSTGLCLVANELHLKLASHQVFRIIRVVASGKTGKMGRCNTDSNYGNYPAHIRQHRQIKQEQRRQQELKRMNTRVFKYVGLSLRDPSR